MTVCLSCKKTLRSAGDIHSYYDHAAVERLRVAERAVIDAALAYCAQVERDQWGEEEVDAYVALDAAVRSLREVTP